MSTNLIRQGYNSNRKTDVEIEKDLANKTNKQVRNQYKESQKIREYISKGYTKDFSLEKKEPLRQTDPDKMNPVQLMAHGWDKRQEEQEKEEKKTTVTIDPNNL